MSPLAVLKLRFLVLKYGDRANLDSPIHPPGRWVDSFVDLCDHAEDDMNTRREVCQNLESGDSKTNHPFDSVRLASADLYRIGQHWFAASQQGAGCGLVGRSVFRLLLGVGFGV